MDRLTKRRLAAFYRELHWLRPILRPYERLIDNVHRENFASRHLEWKLGDVKEEKAWSHVSALLVDSSSASVRIAELTPHSRFNPLKWLLKTLRLIDPVEYWTLYGGLKRLQSGEIQNPDSVVLEKGKWILVFHEREVLRLLGVVAKYEVSITLLKVRSDTKLVTLMSEYDQHAWQQTQVLERRPRQNKRRVIA